MQDSRPKLLHSPSTSDPDIKGSFHLSPVSQGTLLALCVNTESVRASLSPTPDRRGIRKHDWPIKPHEALANAAVIENKALA